MPEIWIEASKIANGINILELLVESGISNSKSEARQLIRGGGARVNDKQIKEEGLIITHKDFIDNNYLKLSSGKKNHVLIKVKN